MSELKDIVPPIELCRQIPAGAFADSALVWTRDLGKSEFYVAVREDVEFCRRNMINAPIHFPAPTMEEIFQTLHWVKLGDEQKNMFASAITKTNHDFFDIGPLNSVPENSSDALQLWLRINAE